MSVLAAVVPLRDKVPDANDVVAGWTGFAVFAFLVVALVLLMVSFVKQLRRTRENFGVDRQGNPVDGNPVEEQTPEDAERS